MAAASHDGIVIFIEIPTQKAVPDVPKEAERQIDIGGFKRLQAVWRTSGRKESWRPGAAFWTLSIKGAASSVEW